VFKPYDKPFYEDYGPTDEIRIVAMDAPEGPRVIACFRGVTALELAVAALNSSCPPVERNLRLTFYHPKDRTWEVWDAEQAKAWWIESELSKADDVQPSPD